LPGRNLFLSFEKERKTLTKKKENFFYCNAFCGVNGTRPQRN